MIQKLRIKFISFSMLIVSIGLLVLFCSVLITTSGQLRRNSIDFLMRVTSEQRPPQPPKRGDRKEMGWIPHFIVQVSEDSYQIENKGFYDLSDESVVQGIIDQVLQSDQEIGVLREYNLRYYRKEMSHGWRIACADLYMEHQTMLSLVRSSLVIGCGAFLAFLILSVLLSRFVVRPVEQAWNKQKQFVADASHELKTPLTVILSNVDMMLAQKELVPLPWRKRAEAIKEESVLMKQLVEELLTLARLDSVTPETQFERVDLSRLILGQILLFEPLAFEKEKQLIYNIREGLLIRGVPKQLEQLSAILLDNALKYSQPKSVIIVDLFLTKEKQARFTVANQGELIPTEELPRLFERFYRGDPARAAEGGYGLGLAIAKNIVQEHRGKIWAESRDGVNTFTVQLPGDSAKYKTRTDTSILNK